MAKPKAKQERDADGYSLAPIDVSKTCWLYAEAAGLTVVQEDRDHNGKRVRILQSLIPWDRIDKARERK